MANVKSGLAKSNTAVTAGKAPNALGVMIGSASVQERFNKMLGDKAPGFLSSLLSLVNNNKLLIKADPKTILAGAATAAALDLPINPSLGQAWLVPYGNGAQFQLGYKGVIALAQRTGQMKSIVMTPVYEGEIRDWNRFTETYSYGEKTSDAIVGYFARFELVNGFAKATYWTKDEVIAHAKRFSKAFGNGPWKTDFDAMACKTVLMSIMKTYCPMSVEMQKAFTADGKVVENVSDDGTPEFIDVDVEADSSVPDNADTDNNDVDVAVEKLFEEQ